MPVGNDSGDKRYHKDLPCSYSQIGLIISGMMADLWLLNLALRDSSIVDIFGGTGFVLRGLMMWIVGGPIRRRRSDR